MQSSYPPVCAISYFRFAPNLDVQDNRRAHDFLECRAPASKRKTGSEWIAFRFGLVVESGFLSSVGFLPLFSRDSFGATSEETKKPLHEEPEASLYHFNLKRTINQLDLKNQLIPIDSIL